MITPADLLCLDIGIVARYSEKNEVGNRQIRTGGNYFLFHLSIPELNEFEQPGAVHDDDDPAIS